MLLSPQNCFYKDAVYRFYTNGLIQFCKFDLDDLTVYDADRLFDATCDVLSLADSRYAISNDAIPLACWSVLLNLMTEEDELYESLISDVCNGFANYLNSESFGKLISADCDNCFPEEVYDSCMKSIFLIQDRIYNPSPLLNTIISKSKNAIH